MLLVLQLMQSMQLQNDSYNGLLQAGQRSCSLVVKSQVILEKHFEREGQA